MVNKNLGICRECGAKSLELKFKQNVGYAVTLAVVCQACENTMNKLRVAEHRDTKKRSLTKGTTQTGRQEISRLNTKIWRNKKQRTAIQNTIKSNMVLPLSIQNTTLNQYTPTRCFENYNVNIRAILMAFFLGTGGQDVGRAMSILGVGGGIPFERSYHRHAPAIGKKSLKYVMRLYLKRAMKRYCYL